MRAVRRPYHGAHRGRDASARNRRRHTAHESPPLRPAPRSEPPSRRALNPADPDPVAALAHHRRAPGRRPVLLQLRAHRRVEGGAQLLPVPESGGRREGQERRVRPRERHHHRRVQHPSGREGEVHELRAEQRLPGDRDRPARGEGRQLQVRPRGFRHPRHDPHLGHSVRRSSSASSSGSTAGRRARWAR